MRIIKGKVERIQALLAVGVNANFPDELLVLEELISNANEMDYSGKPMAGLDF